MERIQKSIETVTYLKYNTRNCFESLYFRGVACPIQGDFAYAQVGS